MKSPVTSATHVPGCTQRVLAMQLVVLPLAVLEASVAGQFILDNSDLPSGVAISSRSEHVGLAVVDLDGNWDAAFADGGDGAHGQNRLWINLGGLQGGVQGDFADGGTELLLDRTARSS